MASATITEHPPRMQPWRIGLAIIIFIALVSTAWIIRAQQSTAEAPSRSTLEANPTVEENVPNSSDKSVQQRGDSTQDSTPSSSGTNGNYIPGQ